jgi:hypothetical protein
MKKLAFLLSLALPATALADDLQKGLADHTSKGKRQLPETPDFTKGGRKNDRHD